MKKIHLFIAFVIVAFASTAQSLSYQDLALVLAQDADNGSARYQAMGGAFGALGGEASAIHKNPAGGAIARNSFISSTLAVSNTHTAAVYYGQSTATQKNNASIAQLGSVFSFQNPNNSDWKNMALTLNYRVLADFDQHFKAVGNSGVATFTAFPLDIEDPATAYETGIEQSFNNETSGAITEFSLGLSAAHKNKFFVGAALHSYSLKHFQQSVLKEKNASADGNHLYANYYQENNTQGNGFSFSAGMLYKVSHNFRLGLAYQTPTIYTDLTEETNIVDNDGFYGDTRISIDEGLEIYDNTAGGYYPVQGFPYSLATPGKVTASAAIIFRKFGLFSIDYSRKHFTDTQLFDADFSSENRFFNTALRNTHNVHMGTEWRLGRYRIRGGYRYEQSTDKNAIASDHLKRISFGGGYVFGNTTLDLSYSNGSKTSLYNFYPQYDTVNATDLTMDTRKFSVTLQWAL